MKEETLKKTALTLSALVHIGKSGLTESVLAEIEKQLKIHKLLKIKLLKNFMDDIPMTKRELGEMLATKTNSVLVSLVGNTVVLYRKPNFAT